MANIFSIGDVLIGVGAAIASSPRCTAAVRSARPRRRRPRCPMAPWRPRRASPAVHPRTDGARPH
jgi:hypothetical protein